MLSRKSLKDAADSLKQWEADNPHATLKEQMKRTYQYFHESTGFKMSLSTLPSTFVPMPESIVKSIERKLKRH